MAGLCSQFLNILTPPKIGVVSAVPIAGVERNKSEDYSKTRKRKIDKKSLNQDPKRIDHLIGYCTDQLEGLLVMRLGFPKWLPNTFLGIVKGFPY